MNSAHYLKYPEITETIKPETILSNDYLLTVTEIATILKTNTNYVYTLIRSGKLKCLKIGSLKCRKATLFKFLEEFDGMDISDPQHVSSITF